MKTPYLKELLLIASETFELLKSKHPFSVPPIVPDSDPSVPAAQLPCTFSIATLLRTFPKGTVCGPSGMRVQHLIDALDAVLPTSIERLLRQVLNILLAGRPQKVWHLF